MKKFINILGIVLVILSLIFVFRRVGALNMDFSRLLTPSNVALLSAMPFLSVMTIFFSSYCWRLVLSLFTYKRIPVGNTFAAYAKSNVMKYLPGNVGHYVGRQIFGSQIGINQFYLGTASALELGYSALSMILFTLLISARTVVEELHTRFGEHAILWIGALVGGGVAVLVAVAILFHKNRYIKLLLELLKTPRFWLIMTMSTLVTWLVSIVYVMEYIAILGQYESFGFRTMGTIIAANFISIFIGYITPGAPGGIGVREAVMLALLSSNFPAEHILFASIVQRLISIVGDVITVPISLLFADQLLAGTESSEDANKPA